MEQEQQSSAALSAAEENAGPLEAFRVGFLDPGVPILLVAMLVAFASLAWFDAAAVWHVAENAPLNRLLRHQHDDAVKIVHRVGEVRRSNSTNPWIYVLGGSSMREAVTSEADFERLMSEEHGQVVQVAVLASAFRSFAQCAAVIESLPSESGIVVLGVNFSRFAWDEKKARAQLSGDPLLLKSTWFDIDSFGPRPHDDDASLALKLNRAMFGWNSLQPGMARYMKDFWQLNHDRLFAFSLPDRQYDQHRYTMTKRRSSPEKKAKSLQNWQTRRATAMEKNLAFNLSMLKTLLMQSKAKGLPIVVVEQTLDHGTIQQSLNDVMTRYKTPLADLTRQLGVPYLDFESEIGLESDDFGDLAHLSDRPGRLRYMRALGSELSSLAPQLLTAANR